MGKKEIEEFLTHLAVDKNVAPTTQNQAFITPPINNLKYVIMSYGKNK